MTFIPDSYYRGYEDGLSSQEYKNPYFFGYDYVMYAAGYKAGSWILADILEKLMLEGQ